MKKFISLLICIIIVLQSFAVVADEIPDIIVNTVKINLNDGAVTLNDEPFELSETPYINENGDTVIDMMLLMKALDANAIVDDDKITVTYEGVSMVYTIGSNEVMVANQTIYMNSPIIRNESGVIIAPLRFVSEALGADVTYDGELGMVVVVSAGGMDEAVNYKLLFKYSGKNKIGNSEEHWRFTKTDNFDMSEDMYYGYYEFAMEDVMFLMMCEKNTGDATLDQYYLSMQDMSYNYDRYVMYDKGKGEHKGVPYVYTKYRTLDTINERYAFETEEYFYLLDLERTFETFSSGKESPDVEAFLNSLEFDYYGGDEENTVDLATLDLSEVSDQEAKTEYVDGNYSWSIKLNDTWEVNEYYGFYNKVSIQRPTGIEDETSDDIYSYLYGYSFVPDPSINITTYSVVEGQSTADWAAKKHYLYKSTVNTDVYNISDVNDVVIGALQAKSFNVEYTDTDGTYVEKFYYVSDGEYRYEIILFYDKREEEIPGFVESANSVIQSFTPGEIDAAEVGKALESDTGVENIDVVTDFEGEMYTVTHPYTWIVYETETGMYLSTEDSYFDMSSYDLMSVLFPQLSFILSTSDELSLMVSKNSLTYYDDQLNLQSYTAEEYMYKTLAGTLNSSNSFFGITMPADIQEVTLMGINGYKTELVVNNEGLEMCYTTYYLPYDDESIITVTKTCSKALKNTVYETALDKALATLKFTEK